MDVYEATRIVMSRIQNLDPENASRIMGLILIQDNGEREMIRLAFGPESLVHSVVIQARKDLGLPSNSLSTPSSSPFLSRQSSSASSRLLGGANRLPSLTIPNRSSDPVGWGAFADLQYPDEQISSNRYNPSANHGVSVDQIDEFQIRDKLSFLNDCSPTLSPLNSDLNLIGGKTTPFPTAYGGGASLGRSVHRRSFSVTDACLGMDEAAGFGWKSCNYFAKGYCKNGSCCRFVHDGIGDSSAMVNTDCSDLESSGTLDMMEQCHELLRSKSAHQQRLAAASQLMASGSFPYSTKYMNYLLKQQQIDSPRATSDDMLKFSRSRLDRNDSINGGPGPGNAASTQIYLTFPADSTFSEEDVSHYFSIYGPVQDVRIPYQQKRMFGFVTFVYPETVKLILAKGNPHFVGEARVLVKPYKEKGKGPDKKHQQMERGEFTPWGTPKGIDPRDLFDLQPGGMYSSSPDSMWRKKLEQQADLQQALELQNRRLMDLRLFDVKRLHQRTLSTGSPIPSPVHSPNPFNQSLGLPSFHSNAEGSPLVKCSSPAPIGPLTSAGRVHGNGVQEDAISKEISTGSIAEDDLNECWEHNLPDNPFASPAKTTGDYSNAVIDGEEDLNNGSLLPAASSINATSFKSYNCQLPGFSSGHGAIGLYAGNDGSTCHVGI